jgi:ribonuclease P protein component
MNDSAARKPQRFPRTARLLKHSLFQAVYEKGKRHFSPHLTAFYTVQERPSSPAARIGITVGRALGGAVERNRIRRRLRDAIRKHLASFHADLERRGTATDVVFNPKKAVLNMEFAKLEAEVERAFAAIAPPSGDGPRQSR